MKFFVTVSLMLCLAVAAFASGEGENEGVYPGKWGKGVFMEEMPEPQVYTGTFKMEENTYPAILTDNGKVYYLMFPGMITGNNLPPADGAAVSIEAFESLFSPVHLMVVSAEVNGEAVDFEWFDERRGAYGKWGKKGWSKKGYYGHQGYYGHHEPGHGGYGWGPWNKPDQDYPEN